MISDYISNVMINIENVMINIEIFKKKSRKQHLQSSSGTATYLQSLNHLN